MRRLAILGRRATQAAGIAAVFGVACLPVTALGADIVPGVPVKAPGNAIVEPSSGLYIWGDGSYQSVGLPNFTAGLARADLATGNAIGPLDTFTVRATGAGFSGGIGYTFRDGTFAPAWGSNVRFEVRGSRIEADADQAKTGSLNAVGLQVLGGFVASGLACIGSCSYGNRLNTDYAKTQISFRATSDLRQPGVTLSPSFEVLGSGSRVDQRLTTSFLSIGATSPFYEARTRLAWQDWGARIGLDGTLHLLPWLDVGIGGRVGLVGRNVEFSGTDVITDGFGSVLAASNIARDAHTTALLANAEAKLTARLSRQISLRAFAGLDYDNRVPGILPASYSGSHTPPRQANPAGIAFSGETSYYAGGGVTIAFNP